MFSSTHEHQVKLSTNIPCKQDRNPSVYFSDLDIDQLSKCYQYTLVAKFSETQPSLDDICDSIQKIGMHGDFTVGFVDKNHVLIKCCIDSDFQTLWMKGAWKICDAMVKVFKWTPSFNPQTENCMARFWVNLPKLKLQFINHVALERIGNSLGTYLETDGSTFDGSRLCLARIYVEMDVSKELPDKIWIGNDYSGYWQQLEYSNVPPYCNICFTLGHTKKSCSMFSESGFVKQVKGIHDEDELCFVCTDSAFKSKSDMRGKRKWVEIDDEDDNQESVPSDELKTEDLIQNASNFDEKSIQNLDGLADNNDNQEGVPSDDEINNTPDMFGSKRKHAIRKKAIYKRVTRSSSAK